MVFIAQVQLRLREAMALDLGRGGGRAAVPLGRGHHRLPGEQREPNRQAAWFLHEHVARL